MKAPAHLLPSILALSISTLASSALADPVDTFDVGFTLEIGKGTNGTSDSVAPTLNFKGHNYYDLGVAESPGLSMQYYEDPVTFPTPTGCFIQQINRPVGYWSWWAGTGLNPKFQMELTDSNQLFLYGPPTDNAVKIILQPGAGTTPSSITLDGQSVLTPASGDARYLRLGSTTLSWGSGSWASGALAISLGASSYAGGSTAVAIGTSAYSDGNYATAIGYNCWATAESATAIGRYSVASGWGSTAVGEARATGESSTALGVGSEASGSQATAIGAYTVASGFSSTAMGQYSLASGSSSTAMGLSTTASGLCSLAGGDHAQTSGDYALALGTYTLASGIASSSFGADTTAEGYASSAFGLSTIAQGTAQFVLGQYNIPLGTEVNLEPFEPILIVGNGGDNNTRSNALVVRRNGGAELGTGVKSSAANQVVVGLYNDLRTADGAGADLSDHTAGLFVVGAGSGPEEANRTNALRVAKIGTQTVVLIQPAGDLDMGEFQHGQKP